jgi:hypothetical protein
MGFLTAAFILRKNQDFEPTQVGFICVDGVFNRRFHSQKKSEV